MRHHFFHSCRRRVQHCGKFQERCECIHRAFLEIIKLLNCV